MDKMSEEQGYNGWTNYETWVTALWIDNDQATHEEAREMTQVAIMEHDTRTGYGTTAAGSLAHALREWWEYQMPDLFKHSEIGWEMGASLWSDLLGAAFSEINWFEIAENYLSEVVDA